ncbi:MAG: UvrD-helicase domain-containing protein [Anaerobacillus sp.]|uniref:UvrD-helicase domain-containing protein n=1 Tax=Anaerobacillus sp. TaxID=1872506 RepID=UPI0039193A63
MFTLFHCAAEEKSKQGLIDFTDQESLALQLLQNETYQKRLKDRITEVFVDEFQDSSQLANCTEYAITRILPSSYQGGGCETSHLLENAR